MLVLLLKNLWVWLHLAPRFKEFDGKLVELFLKLFLLREVDDVFDFEFFFLSNIPFFFQDLVELGLEYELPGPELQFRLEMRLTWG